MKFIVPIRLPSLANVRLHWRRLDRLKQEQRWWTTLSVTRAEIPPLPVVVTITRVGPRKLDDDNLCSACKYIRDAIAQVIGTDDGSPLYTWQYRQQIGEYRVDVEITSREDSNASKPKNPNSEQEN